MKKCRSVFQCSAVWAVVLLVALGAAACDDEASEADDAQQTDETQHPGEIVETMLAGAQAYYESDQTWSTPDGAEPWHDAAEVSEHDPGDFVSFEDKTFPGGENVQVRTSEEIPQQGEKVEPDLQIEGDVDFEPEPVFNQLGVNLDEPLQFRYTFETGTRVGYTITDREEDGVVFEAGPGSGQDAVAVIRAEHEFDPSTDNHHTIIASIEADYEGGAHAIIPYTIHQFE